MKHKHKRVRGASIFDRFFAKVRPGVGPFTCWEWTGAIGRDGYGVCKDSSNKSVRAHKWSYEFSYGPVPDGMELCHRCDRPECVNPDHMFVGTHTDNMRDASQKKRWPGKQTNRSRGALTEEKVRDVRIRCARGESHRDVAVIHGVSRSAVLMVMLGRNWSHVK